MTTRHYQDDDEEANYDDEYHQLIHEDDRYRRSNQERDDHVHSADEFFSSNPHYEDRAIFTGRMRKKQAARFKGGEFQARRQKRRVYFCCISSEIDVQEFHEHCTNEIFELKSKWKTRLYGDALCLSRSRTGESSSPCEIRRRQGSGSAPRSTVFDPISNIPETELDGSQLNKQEVFVFEFGAVVFWGFSVPEEKHLLEVIRDFSKKGLIADNEFVSGEDDMAFVISAEVSRINIANDVIMLPEGTTTKQRLSVSYAIAQSSVVSIFEYRIEKKVEDYKFIPETLAKVGIINDVSSQRVGMMIGDIFVIRHDLNLHTDILDTPDYFWGEEDVYEQVYERVMKYLEMESRVDVINRRLDMLKELLDVLHQQMENAHSTKLEWIIIWLIVLEVIIQVVGVIGGVMGIWVW